MHGPRDCEKAIGSDYLLSGYRKHGETTSCPVCGKIWVHECDEAEGCSWWPK
jgi:hypothetical protein